MAEYELTRKLLEQISMTAEQADEIITPIALGPTWRKCSDGRWLLPERTLGWQVAAWCAEYLRAKDGGPWRFTMEQLRFILWWFAVDEAGEFIHRTGVLQRLKGWGKDPLLAVICLVEFVGPSRVKRTALGLPEWDAEGHPVGTPHPEPWVQIAAVNQAQTRNTMRLIPSLMTDKFIATYGVNPGAELMRANGARAHLEAVTSNYRSLEGGRTTFTVLNETHHWVAGNGGHAMYETIDGNATKMDGRYLAITNAFLPGEDSVAERMRLAWERLQERIKHDPEEDIGFLYDSLEAHPKAPIDGPLLPLVLERIRGDATWLNIKTIRKSIANATMSPARSRRMWLNQVVADEEALIGPEIWGAGDDTLTLEPGDEIVLGFDGSKSRDGTALVAIRVSDMAIFLIDLWERPDGPMGEDWKIDKNRVSAVVHEAFSTYSVLGMFADVREFEPYIADWSEAYYDTLKVHSPSARDGISWDMRGQLKRSTHAHMRLLAAIFEGKLKHDGDARMRRHVMNAQRSENIHGVYFKKASPDSPRKIDAYAALMLAHEALTELRTGRKAAEERKPGRVWFM